MEDEIIEIVERLSGVSRADMEGRIKNRLVCRFRFVSMYLIRKHRYPTLSYQSIGEIFGRDHATVIHAIKKTDDGLCTEKKFRILFCKMEDAVVGLKTSTPSEQKTIVYDINHLFKTA